jgi:hypothetical protein
MPVVLAPRGIPRPQIPSQAGLAFPRGGLGPRAEDCHKLDPRRWPEHPIPTLLHDGRGRRQKGQGHCRAPGPRGKPLVTDLAKLTPAIDDTPTQRYGPFVQGAGIHHNPTPGPAGSPHVLDDIRGDLAPRQRQDPCGAGGRAGPKDGPKDRHCNVTLSPACGLGAVR